MAHPPVHLKPIPAWKRLWRRLGGHDRRLAELTQRAAKARPLASGELWAHGSPDHRPLVVDVRDQPLAYTPPATVALPDPWLQQAAFALTQDTGVVLPLPRLRTLLGTALASQALAAGGITAEVRAGLRDALGRDLIGQGWPSQVERVPGYRVGLRLAAQAAGLETLAAEALTL